MEDDTLGTFRPPKNRRERPARAGYARHADGMPSQTHIPAPPPFQPPRAGLSRDEARASVQMFDRSAVPVPTPPRPFDDSATFQTTSAWTDNSEMDVFAVDGSSYARTLSTVSRPNSEYDLEDGPGAIYVPHNNSTIIDPFAIYSQTDLRTPPPIGYPPLQSSPSGTFGRTTPQAWRDAPPSNGVPIRGVVMPVGGVVPVPLGGVVAPAPSQMALPGPSRRPDGRIPAPRLLVDTKAPFDAVPLSAVNGAMSSGPLSTMPTPLSALGGWSSGVPTPFDHTPSTARALSPETTFAPPSRSTSRGAAFNPVPTASTFTSGPSSSAYPVPSAAYAAGPSYGTRPLVTRHGSRSDDRPSALPYADNEAPGLTRGPTIIRHADGGAFNDAIPNEQGEVHLPPAYDEIYAPNP
ncbi:hypothetical protein CspeluHIS016_0902780 [Cutaneotrichosporon spelunceum]|uniref:Uncharacterized protein n=1 Tax=Cutaneotrichosporon spelunceum TaxID=1672016 RepID=A0AAD3U0I2_9TREE|nr:hypothetical protein CspeluHIS016_0902780 [Cutaneotrichosporon spelunceum]